MPLEYTLPTQHSPGTVLRLLKQAWQPIWNPKLAAKLRRFDGEVTRNPDTVGACTFITCIDGQPVGMGSYDPRQGPERGIIGYNCVVPEHQRKGIGCLQIQEILRIFRDKGFVKACVTTGDHNFFVRAQRMYEACGFVRVGHVQDDKIDYELALV